MFYTTVSVGFNTTPLSEGPPRRSHRPGRKGFLDELQRPRVHDQNQTFSWRTSADV